MCRQLSLIVRTSRWKCSVPLAGPVVPDVKAISATSSCEASAGLKSSDWRSARASRPSKRSVLKKTLRGLLRQCIEFSRQPRIAQREIDLRLGDDMTELARAHERHSRDSNPSGLDHGEPASGEHRRVGRAQQHAVAWHQPQILHQHAGNTVRPLQQLVVAPQFIHRADAGARAKAGRHGLVEKFRRCIDAFRIAARQKCRLIELAETGFSGGKWSRANGSEYRLGSSMEPTCRTRSYP